MEKTVSPAAFAEDDVDEEEEEMLLRVAAG